MVRDVHVVAAVIKRDGRILAARRLPGGAAGGKREFPGGKVEVGETFEQALVREIHEELRLVIAVADPVGTFVSTYEKCLLHLHCFWCSIGQGEAQLHAHSALKWCGHVDLLALDWASADLPAVNAILSSASENVT